jgi:hypothetical protein
MYLLEVRIVQSVKALVMGKEFSFHHHIQAISGVSETPN